jgi:dolichol-phosphate mannosyltransferase
MTETMERRRRRRVHVVLPAFNEEGGIARLLERLDEAMDESGLPYHVVVVDDGSTDDTLRIVREHAERLPITIVEHRVNQGLGVAIRDGLIEAQRRATDADVIVTMDADDTHAPGLILRMVRMIREGHDVVIASRYQKGARTIGVPRSRRFWSFSASIVFRVLFPTHGVRDYTCGFRAYRVEALRAAVERYGLQFVDQDGFQCMVDILLKLRRLDLVFGEVPIILRYDQKEGGTKMRVGETARNTLRLAFRTRLSG